MARKQHTPEEKARLVQETLWGERTISEIASENNIHPNMLSRWKAEAEKTVHIVPRQCRKGTQGQESS